MGSPFWNRQAEFSGSGQFRLSFRKCSKNEAISFARLGRNHVLGRSDMPTRSSTPSSLFTATKWSSAFHRSGPSSDPPETKNGRGNQRVQLVQVRAGFDQRLVRPMRVGRVSSTRLAGALAGS